MYTIRDCKKHKTLKLLNFEPISFFKTMSSGATLSLKNSLVNMQEIKDVVGLREQSRNNPLGIIITKPSEKSFFLGTAWEDMCDNGQHDEDLTLFTEVALNNFELERMNLNDIKKKFPQWKGYHHGDKSYLK